MAATARTPRSPVSGCSPIRSPPALGKPGTDSFEDPRLRGLDKKPYDPLPREWGQWQGLGLHDNRVILHYKIAGRHVLESPSYKESDGVGAVIRTMNFEERDEDIMLQVVKGEGQAKVSTHDRISVAKFDGLAVALSAEAGGAKFVATDDGHLRLAIPSGGLLALNLAIANGKAEALAKLVSSAWPSGESSRNISTRQRPPLDRDHQDQAPPPGQAGRIRH